MIEVVGVKPVVDALATYDINDMRLGGSRRLAAGNPDFGGATSAVAVGVASEAPGVDERGERAIDLTGFFVNLLMDPWVVSAVGEGWAEAAE